MTHQNNTLVGPNSQNVTPFNFNGAYIRTIAGENDEPLFVARDVAAILGYSAPRNAIAKYCKGRIDMVLPTNGGPQKTVLIPERDVYRLAMNSKLPSAEIFEEWVVAEVLPSLRKTGAYSARQKQEQQSAHSLDVQLLFVERASSILRCSETSKIRMLANVASNNGLPSNLLPSYTDEKLTRSLSELLKLCGSDLSATKANKILLELGYLQKLTRPSTGKTTKEFWNITSTGLRYGKNEISVQNDKETQPRWYEETFGELLSLINQQKAPNENSFRFRNQRDTLKNYC
jgi:prophage antirepressor-like protein